MLQVAGTDQLCAWEGETLAKASMESCTATAGFHASSSAGEMLLQLDRAAFSLADACSAFSPDLLPELGLLLRARGRTPCLASHLPAFLGH